MDQVRAEFEEQAQDLRVAREDAQLNGTDDENSLRALDELINSYRARIDSVEYPSEARALIERFRTEAERL